MTIDLDTLELQAGGHRSPEDGMCLLELCSYLSPTSEFTDSPLCVSPVIASFGRQWNDALDDETRQLLKPYAPRMLNTATGAKDEEKRAWMLTDWLARECAPAFLRLAGLTGQAELLESLAPLTSAAAAGKAQPTLDKARKEAAAARAAAGAAARDAARDAAGAAARAAAGAAAGDAARDAAGAAARDAAWDAARDAAWDAAGAAARAATRAAASKGKSYAAARKAADEALAPTVKELQESAFRLLDRMIEVGKVAA